MKPLFRGLKELLLSPQRDRAAMEVAALRARALFRPPGSAMKKDGGLIEFLAQVTLFEDLGRRDLARLARIVHEREYGDGEYICEEGKPGAALFIVRRGVVEVVKGGAGDEEVALALLEPPASFEEPAALGTEVVRWFSVRARGPVSLLALGRSDLEELAANFPMAANKVLFKLASLLAGRLRMLIHAEIPTEPGERAGGEP